MQHVANRSANRFNDLGVIAGSSTDANGVEHAYIPPGLGGSRCRWTCRAPWSRPSSTCGTTASSRYTDADGNIHGFVGEPVPEPGTLTLLGSGLAGLAAWRRRARSR